MQTNLIHVCKDCVEKYDLSVLDHGAYLQVCDMCWKLVDPYHEYQILYVVEYPQKEVANV